MNLILDAWHDLGYCSELLVEDTKFSAIAKIWGLQLNMGSLNATHQTIPGEIFPNVWKTPENLGAFSIYQKTPIFDLYGVFLIGTCEASYGKKLRGRSGVMRRGGVFGGGCKKAGL